MYDMDRDGSISKGELLEMLRTSTEETGLVLTEEQVRRPRTRAAARAGSHARARARCASWWT